MSTGVFQPLNFYMKRRGKRIIYSFSSVLKQNSSLHVPFSGNQSSGDLQETTLNKGCQTASYPGLMTSPNGKLRHLSYEKPGELDLCSHISVTVTILYKYLYTLLL